MNDDEKYTVNHEFIERFRKEHGHSPWMIPCEDCKGDDCPKCEGLGFV